MVNKEKQFLEKERIIEIMKQADGFCLIGFAYTDNGKDMAFTEHINSGYFNPYIAKICLPTMKHQFKETVKKIEEAELQKRKDNRTHENGK